MMTKYESSVKRILSSNEQVYGKLSNLTNLESLRNLASDATIRKRLDEQVGDKVTPDQIEQFAQLLESMRLTPDTLTTDVPMMGSLTLRIVEREEPKLVKFELEGAPMQANLWIQLLPKDSASCAMKVTIGAELNFFMKQMLNKKLQEGVERFADLLAIIPYS